MIHSKTWFPFSIFFHTKLWGMLLCSQFNSEETTFWSSLIVNVAADLLFSLITCMLNTWYIVLLFFYCPMLSSAIHPACLISPPCLCSFRICAFPYLWSCGEAGCAYSHFTGQDARPDSRPGASLVMLRLQLAGSSRVCLCCNLSSGQRQFVMSFELFIRL